MDKLDIILEKLASMDQGITEMKQDIGGLKQDIKNVDNRQSELYEIVTAIRHNQESQRAEHDAMVLTISGMQGDITSINQKIDHLAESQDRQDKILESLSLRSLEQETDIRELKRIK
jgi:chromosome segregation ATPase